MDRPGRKKGIPAKKAKAQRTSGKRSGTTALETSTAKSDIKLEDKQLIRLQLVLMIHSNKCSHVQCSVPNCAIMKQVLDHMPTCKAGESCTVEGCTLTTQIAMHFDECLSTDCPMNCVNMKFKILNHEERMSEANERPPDAALQGGQLVCVPITTKRGPSCAKKPATKKSQLDLEPKLQSKTSTAQNFLMNNIQSQWVAQSDSSKDQAVLGPSVTAEQSLSCAEKPYEEESQPHLRPIMQSKTTSTPDFWMNDVQSQLNAQPGSSKDQAVLGPSVTAECGPSCAGRPAEEGSQPYPNAPDSLWNYLLSEEYIQLSSSRDWRRVVGIILRQLLVQKMVHVILPTLPPSLLGDPRLSNLLEYLYNVENEVYESASSKQEYYEMLVEKLYTINMELKKNEQNTDNIQGAGATSPYDTPDLNKLDILGRLPKRFSS